MNFSAVLETNLGQVTIEAVRQKKDYRFFYSAAFLCCHKTEKREKGGSASEYGCIGRASHKRSQLQ